MKILSYRPHPLLRSGHLQTLMNGMVCGFRPPYNAQRREVQLHDGERLVVHEESGAALADDAPLAILIHGLGGDHSSPYLQRLAHRLRSRGMRVWRVDLRGHGSGLDLAWRPANAGSSQDLADVVIEACQQYPNVPIRLAGFSLSGNILLKMLGEAAAGELVAPFDLSRIDHAIAVAPPINLHCCADNMDRWTRRIYTRYYLKNLNQQVQRRRQRWPRWRSVPAHPPIKTIRQFDARYTAPLSGFASTDEYYTIASARKWLPQIVTRTTILVDRHDPIVDFRAFHDAEFPSNTSELIITSHGGHLGYFGLDETGATVRWMEHFVEQTLR